VEGQDDEQIELQEAADRLGVHYQTAYRWVRAGRLPAHLMGGRYLISAADLVAFDEQRKAPGPPTRPSAARLDRQAHRVRKALVQGDEATVRSISRRLVSDGTSIIDLVHIVFVPPLRWIGKAWHDGELSIWVEHRASAIVERTLGELSPNPRGRRRGTVMVAAVSGDRHSLPTLMAAVALRDANWHVHHLGADMPGDELVRFCAEHPVDLAVISLTNPDVAGIAGATAEQIRQSGTPVIVGGPGRSLDDLVAEATEAVARRGSEVASR
jgi:excisionase family DNA binding protein